MVTISLLESIPLSHNGGYPPHRVGTSLTLWWQSPTQNWYLSLTMVAVPLAHWVPLSHDSNYALAELVPLLNNDPIALAH